MNVHLVAGHRKRPAVIGAGETEDAGQTRALVGNGVVCDTKIPAVPDSERAGL